MGGICEAQVNFAFSVQVKIPEFFNFEHLTPFTICLMARDRDQAIIGSQFLHPLCRQGPPPPESSQGEDKVCKQETPLGQDQQQWQALKL